MKETTTEKSLVTTLKNSELSSITSSVLEVGVDKILEDGVLKELPVISIIAKTLSAGLSVRDYFFVKKLLKFLMSMSDMSIEDRQILIEKLEADKSYRHKVGENIIMLLDRIDDYEKPELIAKAFKAYASGKIDSTLLQRLNYSIERLLLCDLDKLPEFLLVQHSDNYDVVIGQNFVNAGLAYVPTGYGAAGITPTEVCKHFVEILLNES